MILLGYHHPGLPVVTEDEIGDSRQLCDDAGKRTCHRLDHHGPEPFLARWEHEHVGRLEQSVNIIPETKLVDVGCRRRRQSTKVIGEKCRRERVVRENGFGQPA